MDFNKLNRQLEWLLLEYFDDTTFDDNGNQDWIARQTDEDGHHHPLTGKGLCEMKDGQFKYLPLVVREYDAKLEKFTGRWIHSQEPFALHRYMIYNNIRLYICFDAEDPRRYVLRVANAFQERIYADSLVRYNYLIDNMPLHDLSELDTE